MAQQRRGSATRPKVTSPEPQPAGLNQLLLFRIALAVLVLMGVGAFSAVLLIRPEVDVVGDGPGAARAQKELAETLERLRSTWDPEARERILKDAPEQDARFVGALRRILKQWNHPLRLQAIEYAGAFGAEELRPEVAVLAGSGRADLRAAAVRAAERLGPWANEDLSEFLDTKILEVQVAALGIVAERQDGPWPEVIGLLASDHAEVRAAASAAVPPEPPAKAMQVLWAVIEAGPAEVTALGLAALGRTDRIRDFEAAVSDLMPGAETEVQLAALECLGAKTAPLEDPQVVRDLAWDFSVELRVRAMAFRCLERTSSYDVAELRSGAFTLEPKLQYFAARCLITSGDAHGLVVLAELADGKESEVEIASRRLLARLTGLSPQAAVADFRAKIDQGVELAGPLPAPGFTF